MQLTAATDNGAWEQWRSKRRGEGWWTWKARVLFSTKSWLDVWRDAQLLFYACSTKARLRCLPCHPEALINKAAERGWMSLKQSFPPAFRSLSKSSVQWRHNRYKAAFHRCVPSNIVCISVLLQIQQATQAYSSQVMVLKREMDSHKHKSKVKTRWMLWAKETLFFIKLYIWLLLCRSICDNKGYQTLSLM